MRTSKFILAGVGVTAIAATLVSFSGKQTEGNADDDKKKKYHVIHQKDGEMHEYDTIIPMTSNYSVEDFLSDKGIDDAEPTIIKVPPVSNAAFITKGGENTQVFMHQFDENTIINEEGGEYKEVKIIREENNDGEVTVRKYMNGEEVEMLEEELERLSKGENARILIIEDSEMENPDMDSVIGMMIHEDSEKVEMKVQVDEKGNTTVQKFVNGEEVEVSEEEMERIKNEQTEMIIIDRGSDDFEWTTKEGKNNVELKIDVDDKGNMNVQKFVNGEEVEVSEEEMERIKNGEDQRIMFIQEDFTGDINMDIDSLLKTMQIEVDLSEEGIGEGSQRFYISKNIENEDSESGEAKEIRQEIHVSSKVELDGDEEDFTVVLVHENYDESIEENTQIQVLADNQNTSAERQMSLNEPISVYPNPNNGTFTIAFNQKNEQKTSIRVVDAQGKVVFKEKLGDFAGSYQKELNLKKHGAGVFIVTVQQGDETSSRKVIVE